jgi:ribonucleotide reductase beta subunit family protein with ferritin-like domain
MYEPYEPDIAFVEAIENSELAADDNKLSSVGSDSAIHVSRGSVLTSDSNLVKIHCENTKKIDPEYYAITTGRDIISCGDGYAFFPVLRPEILKYYYDQVKVHWVPSDIDMRQDRQDFDALEPDIQIFIEGILAFFVPSDGIVNENIFKNFQEDTSFWKEARAFYAAQAFMETIHSEMYSLMAQTLIRDPVKLDAIYNSIVTYPCVNRIAGFMKKYMDRSLPLSDRIIAFACVEGVLFTSAFAAIYWLKKRNVMRGFCKANEFIARDEGIHTKFAVALYLSASNEGRLTPAVTTRTYEIIEEAVDVGTQFIREILKVDKIGMSVSELVEYTKCTADALLYSLGHEKLYNVTNPFDWMAIISLPNKTNFFEDKVSEYTQQTEKEFIFDENAYF